jgi:hypothetical protein
MKVREGMKLKGTVHGVLRGPDGRVKEQFTQDNLIVDIGFENVNDLLTAVGGNALTHVAIGWAEPDATPGAPAASDINLPMPGGTPPLAGGKQDRVAAVVTKLTDTTFKLVSSWGSGEPASAGAFPVPIRSIGTFWNSGQADNELFSWVLRSVINKASADTLEITFTYTLS